MAETTKPGDFDPMRCSTEIELFCEDRSDALTSAQTQRILRLLKGSDTKLRGNASGWAAGIIYYLANRDRIPCGVPGLLNSEFTAFFKVSMKTVRRRAAAVARIVEV